MSMVINTNVSSLKAQRSLTSATKTLNTQIERLSTGYKINKAADDAAGLAIAQGLETQIRGSNVASTNAQAGINLLQTAEGDLAIIQENLQRIRDLTVQAANGTYSDTEQDAIKKEVDARIEEIDRTAKGSKFNAINLLDDSTATAGLVIQVGANAEASVNALNIGSVLGSALCSNLSSTYSFDNTTVDSYLGSSATKSAASFLSVIDDAIATVSTRRSGIGAIQNRLESAVSSLSVKNENLSSAQSRIQDTDIAESAAELTKAQILQQTSTSLLTQANQTPSLALSLLG